MPPDWHYGSPPRAWGLLEGRLANDKKHRFTPTCVGTTGDSATSRAGMTVHPHVRGDYSFSNSRAFFAAGSPPRAWGLQYPAGANVSVRRFTPTCVGTTDCHSTTNASIAVHPHVRGDYKKLTPILLLPFGSPPRAWGLLVLPERKKAGSRFTPTCVGTTRVGFVWTKLLTVHPHVRGDYSSATRSAHQPNGSPPRAWGLPTEVMWSNGAARFTPTCVGTTVSGNSQYLLVSVHPHVRGDYKKQ